MAERVTAVVENLIEVTESATMKRICNMLGSKSVLEDLNKTLYTIACVLLDAESKRNLSHATRGYIEDLKAAVYDADDLFFTLAELNLLDGNRDDKSLETESRFFSDKEREVSQAHRLSRQVKDIKEQLDTIVSNHHNFGLSVNFNPICTRREPREETFSYVNAGDIIGREDDKKVVIDMLLGPNDVQESFRFVTIVGGRGLGKTALAQLVYNDNDVVAEFPDPKLRLWVCVSDRGWEQFYVKVILRNILELLSGKRLDDTSAMESVKKQFKKQLGGKKYLLVLDIVRNDDCEKWHNLCRFLTLGQEGSRIVVTTRSEMTAKIIGEKHTHKLQGLSEDNSCLLFKSLAIDKGVHEDASHLGLVEIGKRIVEKWFSIPLAITVVGSPRWWRPVNEWQRFEHSGFDGIGKGDDDVMSMLNPIYHNHRPSLKDDGNNLRRRFVSGKKKEVSQAHRMSRQVKDIKEELDTTVSNHHKIGLSVVDYNPICDAEENQQNRDQANIHVSLSTTSSTNSFVHIPKTIRSKTLGNRDCLNWVFVVLNVVVEICQATFSQEKNQGKMRPKIYFILSIITSSICLMMAILEMFRQGKGAGIVWRKRGYCCWFYYPGNEGRLFGRFSLYFGLISSMIQLIINLLQKLTKKDIVKFDYIPLLLAICYMVAAIIGTQEKTPSAILIRCNVHGSSVVEGINVEGYENRVYQCPLCQTDEYVVLNRI